MKQHYIIALTLSLSSFHTYAIEPLPEYWNQWESEKGTFNAGFDKNIYRSSPNSLTIKSNTKSISKEVTRSGICQRINIEKYIGKRIRYSAYVKTKNIEQWAYIYASSGNVYPSKGIKGNTNDGVTKDWTQMSMVFDIPKKHDKDTISLCFSLWDGGQMWMDDIKWEIVDKSIPITYKAPVPLLNEPILK